MFAQPAVDTEERAGGALLVRSRIPLGPYPITITSRLRHWAHTRPESIFLRERDGDGWRALTYAEADDAMRRIAAGLLALGLGRTTPVAILSEASIAHALVSLAALHAGIPVAPVSPAYSTRAGGDFRRLRSVLDALQPHLIVVADTVGYTGAIDTIDRSVPVAFERGSLEGRITHRLDELARRHDDDAVTKAHSRIAAGDVAKILFTSGSTGAPKGVMNTHRMLCANQQSIAGAWPFLAEHELVLTDWLPWHHTFGGNHNFNMALYHGGTLVIDDGLPLPDAVARSIDALRSYPPTVYFNVPRGHQLIVEALSADPSFAQRFFSRLRVIGNAAAALPAATWSALRDLAARYGHGPVPVAGAWGLTETAPMATIVHAPAAGPAAIGIPGPGTELLLVPAGAKLEARVRGPNVTPGYWRREDLTRAAFDDDGFYKTGDAVRFADPDDLAQGLLFDGRLAENFKLSSGTWVDAGAIRSAVLAAVTPLAADIVVDGEGRDEIGILMFSATASRDAIAARLRAYNAGVQGSSVRVGRALIAAEPLSAADGEITDKGSVNQRLVRERRPHVIEQLWSGAGETIVMSGEESSSAPKLAT